MKIVITLLFIYAFSYETKLFGLRTLSFSFIHLNLLDVMTRNLKIHLHGYIFMFDLNKRN